MRQAEEHDHRDSGEEYVPLNETAYLTTAEASAFLRIAPKTLRNKVAAGIFLEGEHFYKKPGLGRRWKREALVA
jgi:hypothetical protein